MIGTPSPNADDRNLAELAFGLGPSFSYLTMTSVTPTRFSGIIFDFDGVIVDSEIIANRALAQLLTELGLPTSLEEALRDYCGKRFVDCTARVELRLGRPLPADFGQVRQAMMDKLSEELLRPVQGVGVFLHGTTRWRRAIASSSPSAVITRDLARFQFSDHFRGNIFSAASLERSKPDPQIYLIAADAIHSNPADTLAIEDSPTGVVSAVAAGMTVVGLLAGSHVRPGHAELLRQAGAHQLFHTYEELMSWLVSAR